MPRAVRPSRADTRGGTVIRYLLIVALFVAAACSSAPPEDSARREAFVAAVEGALPGDTIRLQDSLGSDWDRVAFLSAYYDNESARETLGFDFDYEGVSPWEVTEGGTIVVLAEGAQLVSWMAVPSEDVGLRCFDAEVVAAEDGMFTVVLEDGRWRSLVPAGEDSCF